MPDPLLTALIAASAALAVAYLNSILAESYRRKRDKVSLAAALAGELASYKPAFSILEQTLKTTVELIGAGKRDALTFRPFDKPKDLVYERAIEKIGLLGPRLVEDVVYFYGNINAFRVSFGLVSNHFAEMSDAEVCARCAAALEALERAVQRGGPLLYALRSVARS